MTEPTSQIYLHAHELDIAPVKVMQVDGGKEVAVKAQVVNTEMEQLRLELSDRLQPNTKYLVKIDFKGKLGDILNGLYRSSYFDPATNTTR